MAAIDIACWDLCARAHGQPLYRLLGHDAHELPVYGTVGLLSLTEDELRQQTEKVLGLGVHGVKLMVGHPDPRIDVARVRAVADVVGPSRRVMIDANCAFRTLPEALERMEVLRELPVFWIEEPLQPPISALDLPDHLDNRRASQGLAPYQRHNRHTGPPASGIRSTHGGDGCLWVLPAVPVLPRFITYRQPSPRLSHEGTGVERKRRELRNRDPRRRTA